MKGKQADCYWLNYHEYKHNFLSANDDVDR